MSSVFVTPVSSPRTLGSVAHTACGSAWRLAVSCARTAWDGLCSVSKAQMLMRQGPDTYRRRLSRRYY